MKSFTYVLDLFRKTADKASDKLSDSISSMLARSITAIGMASAVTLLPIALRLRGLEWVQSSYIFIRDNIAPMANLF